METITINYRADDYLEANRIAYRHNSAQQTLRIIYIILAILFTLIFVLKYLMRQEVDSFAVFFIIFALMFIFYEWTFLPSSSKKMFEQQKKYFQEVTLSFAEDTISQFCSISEVKLKWFYKHILTDKMLLIFTTPLTFIIVPKKYCASEEQYTKICQIVTNFPQGY